ncbi:helix-turn-helix transcriptional regulator [Streptomyces sp. MZ04]|uniref:helix-turn-helix domain-containing protein n=1 Tax=Streptomyces sp. MZ04 TaxID=2559236 RepID=UPI00107E7092|nr:helix-turn-helix transcriptional regulator [Streptomyces sp. MZ04]TGB09775.1 XRE family transcriptional regulator [Streptomyces sp. MZ04]
MDHTVDAADPVGTIRARVKELRTRKGWTATELGAQMTAHGIRWDRSIVANLENGRRATVSVNELLALSRVFDVAPVHLLVPVVDQPFRITDAEAYPARRVREWFRGESPLPGTDERMFRTEVPLDELPQPIQMRPTVEGRSMAEAIRTRYREVMGQEADDDTVLDLMTGVKKMPGGGTDGEGA